jgi:hypothetical protein
MLGGMEWVNEPPCTELDVEREDLTRGLLVLRGPRGLARAKGGLVAAMGTAFAMGAVAFLRMPFPKAWKVIPALMAATGGGVAAMGVTTAVSEVKVQVERGKGIRWTWRPRPMPAREVFVAASDIADYEVKTNVTRSSGEFSFQQATSTSYSLMVITKQGKAYSVEEFGLHKQAELRRDQIQRALGDKASKAKKDAPPRRKRA